MKKYNCIQIANELGYGSWIAFQNKLMEEKIQFLVGDSWVLCGEYFDCDYVGFEQYIDEDDGSVSYIRYWTEKGREFLVEKLK